MKMQYIQFEPITDPQFLAETITELQIFPEPMRKQDIAEPKCHNLLN